MPYRNEWDPAWDRPRGLDVGNQQGGSILNQIVNVLLPDVGVPRWGPAKAILALGVVACAAGFVSFAYAVVRFLVMVFTEISQDSMDMGPPDTSFMMPWMPLGIGSFIGGIILIWMAGLGTVLFGRRGPRKGAHPMPESRAPRGGGFHIEGGQHAGRDVNNVQGNIGYTGDSYDQSRSSETYVAGRDLRIVRDAIWTLPLAPETRRSADETLGQIETEAAKATPDKRRIARRLEEVTETLSGLNELHQAGSPLAAALRRLFHWSTAALPAVLLAAAT